MGRGAENQLGFYFCIEYMWITASVFAAAMQSPFCLCLNQTPQKKSVITALCIGHLQKAIRAVLPGVRKHNVPFTAGEMKAGSSS